VSKEEQQIYHGAIDNHLDNLHILQDVPQDQSEKTRQLCEEHMSVRDKNS